MNKAETIKLLSLISLAYPTAQFEDEHIELWLQFLKDVPFEKAKGHLIEHIRSNRFPPTIADIVRHDPTQFTDYGLSRMHTVDYLKQLEERQSNAIDCPPQFSRLRLMSGG